MRTTLTLCSALVIAATAAAPALANDTKTYPGSACQASVPNQFVYLGAGQISNQGPTNVSVYVECPVIKDMIDHDIEGATVWVLDRHRFEDVYCSLFSMRSNALAIHDFSTAHSTSWTTAFVYQKLKLVDPANDGDPDVNAYADDYYHLLCSIPGPAPSDYSAIVSYQVDERE